MASTASTTQLSLSVTLGPYIVSVHCGTQTPSDVLKFLQGKNFNDWSATFSDSVRKEPSAFKLDGLHILSLTMVGKEGDATNPRRALFAKFDLKATYQGKYLPGVVFMRGSAVAILVLLINPSTNKLYTILVKQFRTPFGCNKLELVAGMTDGQADPIGIALTELYEETHLKLKMSDLIELGITEPSVGGCDEFIKLYRTKPISITDAQLKELEGRLTGNEHEGEIIELKIVEIDQLCKETNDAKMQTAMFLWITQGRPGLIETPIPMPVLPIARKKKISSA